MVVLQSQSCIGENGHRPVVGRSEAINSGLFDGVPKRGTSRLNDVDDALRKFKSCNEDTLAARPLKIGIKVAQPVNKEAVIIDWGRVEGTPTGQIDRTF